MRIIRQHSHQNEKYKAAACGDSINIGGIHGEEVVCDGVEFSREGEESENTYTSRAAG